MMSNYNPNIHNRRSIRLKGYDYSQAGLYFITICSQDRECLFGEVENDEIILNDAGKIAKQCWLDIPEHFPNVVLHEYVIMPNHVHGIIEIVETVVGANIVGAKNVGAYVGAKNFSPLHSPRQQHSSQRQQHSSQRQQPTERPRGTSKTIGSMVRGFKIGVTKWMRQNTKTYDVWQRNYYESIIWNEQSYNRISEYIKNNPKNWQLDEFYKS